MLLITGVELLVWIILLVPFIGVKAGGYLVTFEVTWFDIDLGLLEIGPATEVFKMWGCGATEYIDCDALE